MKNVVIVLFCTCCFFSVGTGAQAQSSYSPKPDEEIYGTWTNSAMQFQKNVSFAGGSRDYNRIDDTIPAFESKAQLNDKWTDSDGNIWYTRFGTVVSGLYAGEKWQSLERISRAGNVREWVVKMVSDFSPKNYPTAIDPADLEYRIYYRAAK